MSRLLYCFLLLFFFTGCKKNESSLSTEKRFIENIVLFYIAANNDLKYDALRSFDKIKKSYKFDSNKRIMVYLKTESDQSYLLALEDNKIDTLYTYINENSSDPLFLKKVIADSRYKYSANKYGLILWSHATSWKPTIKTKSFGFDEQQEMDIKEMAIHIPKDFEYIIFDACTMAGIEVLYELRKNAQYILASPTEVLSSSFPYDQLVNDLFGGVSGLKNVAREFIKYYNQQSGLHQSATISLVRTDKLEAIAASTKRLVNAKKAIYPFNIAEIQELTFDLSSNVPSYDLLSFLKNNYEPHEYAELDRNIDEAVVFKGYTSTFLGAKILDYCGLSVYLPSIEDRYLNYYSSLQWSKDSSWDHLFK